MERHAPPFGLDARRERRRKEEEPIPVTPKLRLTPKQSVKRREMNVLLYRGSKRLYEVEFQYKGTKTETIAPIEARSLPDALGKAQRKRSPNKYLPKTIIINLIGETKR